MWQELCHEDLQPPESCGEYSHEGRIQVQVPQLPSNAGLSMEVV